jgi:glycyl-tRNA synthetase beta chain
MKNVILEIGTENLPARFIEPTLLQLKTIATDKLSSHNVDFEKIDVMATYKRLILYIEDMAERTKDIAEEISGPPAHLLKDKDGKFTVQSTGFAKSQGTTPDRLDVMDTPKGQFLAVKKIVKGQSTLKLLKAVLPEIIQSLEFPKTMIWEQSGFRFARPIRNVLALYGDKNIPFAIAGVKTSKNTRLLGQKLSRVKDVRDYFKKLDNSCVVLSSEKRKELIISGTNRLVSKADLKADMDESLIDENVFLCEHPIPSKGSFNPDFLKLPPELIVTVLKKQLKFFPVFDKTGKKLQPCFIAIRDGLSDNQHEVVTGYEKVVEARLSDATYFFGKDLSTGLEKMRQELQNVMFHEKLGSLFDKTKRVKLISKNICDRLPEDFKIDVHDLTAIGDYCYVDLISEVVREFPELQGYMGGQYAKHFEKPAQVAKGVREFYYPLSADSKAPSAFESAIVSLAGKIDTVCGNFAVGLIPSGSEDPHGLRRQTFGAIRIILEKNIPVSVFDLVDMGLKAQPPKAFEDNSLSKEALESALKDFIWQRVETYFEEKGFKFDEIRAIKAIDSRSLSASISLPSLYARIQALHKFRKNDDFSNLAPAFKRISNILKKANSISDSERVEASLFDSKSPSERELHEWIVKTTPQISATIGDNPDDLKSFEDILKNLTGVKPTLDRFFDEVMVMHDDMKIRNNRIALLKALQNLFLQVADISQLQ